MIAPERPRLSAGTVLSDRFQIVEFLGAGCFGEVYKARQLLFGRGFRDVALKLFAEGVVNPGNAGDVLNDALVLFGLLEENPSLEIGSHLVQVYDMGVVSCPVQRAFMSMRLIPGRKTLRSEVYRFRHGGGMPVSLSLRYLREMLLPLAWMHSLETPAVHGDLKPENVMMAEGAHLVLVDFGLAARMPLGVRGGTISYDAPERLVDLAGGPASDVYSVGLIWYELLTGNQPFEDVGMEALASGDSEAYTRAQLEARKWPMCAMDELPVSQQRKRIVPASDVNHDLAEQHPQLELLLRRCLTEDVSKRIPNARVLLDLINSYIVSGTLSKSDLEVIGAHSPIDGPQAPQRPLERTREARAADALTLVAQRRFEEAVAMADGVLKDSPRFVPALLAKAKALASFPARLEEAAGVCSQAMETLSDDPEALETLALIRDAQGKRAIAAGLREEAGKMRSEPRKTRRGL